MSRTLEKVQEIIDANSISPTIVNPSSNFVVTTYWWGRGNKNLNTARPCVAFYEIFLQQIQKIILATISKLDQKTVINVMESRRILEILERSDKYKKALEYQGKIYNDMIYQDLNINLKLSTQEKEKLARHKLNQMQEGRSVWKGAKMGTVTPAVYNFKNVKESASFFRVIVHEFIYQCKEELVLLNALNKKVQQHRLEEMKRKDRLTPSKTVSLKKKLSNLHSNIARITDTIKQKMKNKTLKFKNDYLQTHYSGKNIYDIMHDNLQYLSPVQFEEMIAKWEKACADNNCNYMAVEYPEFAQPGGYQLAINAKPMFIVKALESCGNRAVVYIDGDMFIRQYPTIFDRTDYDFMARGWNMDPRSSYNIDTSITFDPYTFETSGGIQWFSQNPEAIGLAKKWVEVSSTKAQHGKADDRILSLLINTYKYLCPLKMINLPVEYLWLTLDYDDRMIEHIYDWDYNEMEETKMVEHSECLTTEESAASASGTGSGNDRQAKFYGFLEDNIDPISEEYHEYLNFDNETQIKALKPYLNYMKTRPYINDGEEKLIMKGLVDPNDPSDESNEYPLYITNFKDKYGNKPYFGDTSVTKNEVANANKKRVTNMNIKNLNLATRKLNGEDVVIIEDFSNLMQGVIVNNNLNSLNKTSKSVSKKTSSRKSSPRKTNSKSGTKKSKSRSRSGSRKSSPRSTDVSIGGNKCSYNMQGGNKDHKKIISLIIRLLEDNKTVLYNPVDEDGYDVKYVNSLIDNINTLYKRSEFVYVPLFNNSKAPYSMNYFYKAEISLNQPILFRPSKFLIKFLYMFLSLEDFSAYLANGSYEFMSNTRVSYIIDKKGKNNFIKSKPQTSVKTLLNRTKSANSVNLVGGRNKTRKTKKRVLIGKKETIQKYYEGMRSLTKN